VIKEFIDEALECNEEHKNPVDAGEEKVIFNLLNSKKRAGMCRLQGINQPNCLARLILLLAYLKFGTVSFKFDEHKAIGKRKRVG